MIAVKAAGPGTPAERSLAACLASLLELERAAVPAPGKAPPLVALRQWLAERGLGIPSGVIFDPLGLPQDPPGRVHAGYVLAALEPPPSRPTPVQVAGGRAEAIFVAPQAGAPMRQLDEVRAIAGQGLEGDCYAIGQGTFTVPGGRGNEVTLIAGEVLDALALPDRRPLSAAEARRNIITRGLDLNTLAGRRFRISKVELIGRRRCEPCAHLQRLTRPGVLRALVGRGGLRADLLNTGTLQTGDTITPADDHE